MIEKHSTGHIPVMVSTTDFTTIALALADDSVKNATAGDFVRILSLSLLGVNSPPVVVAGITVVSITPSGLSSKKH
jgi:hypothetical protein